MDRFKFLIPIALMAAILGGLVFVGVNRKTDYTPSEEIRQEHPEPSYPDQFTCEGHACDKL
jgi:hypothetical protein